MVIQIFTFFLIFLVIYNILNLITYIKCFFVEILFPNLNKYVTNYVVQQSSYNIFIYNCMIFIIQKTPLINTLDPHLMIIKKFFKTDSVIPTYCGDCHL